MFLSGGFKEIMLAQIITEHNKQQNIIIDRTIEQNIKNEFLHK